MNTKTKIVSNLDEITNKIIDLRKELELVEYSYKSKTFELLSKMPEIEKLMNDLENVQNGGYSFDDFSLLTYFVEVPKELSRLPFVKEYLSGNSFYLEAIGNDCYRLVQCMGDYISINTSGDSSTYFVYDSESRTELIKHSDILPEGHPTITENEYIAAIIELHQMTTGTYNDVVETNYHGSYVRHFSTFEALGIKTEATREYLTNIVNQYEALREEY